MIFIKCQLADSYILYKSCRRNILAFHSLTLTLCLLGKGTLGSVDSVGGVGSVGSVGRRKTFVMGPHPNDASHSACRDRNPSRL